MKDDREIEEIESKIMQQDTMRVFEAGGRFTDITRRDWLAGLAMQGLVSTQACALMPVEDVAQRAYQLAAAMIAEGRKEQK